MPDPRTLLLAAARVGFAMLLIAAVGAVAHLPLGSAPTDSELRLALRTSHAQIEVCRDRSDAELAALPAHMRQRRDCKVTPVSYRLRLRVDGIDEVDRVVRHHGVRHNRPLVVDELLPIAAGSHDVEIDFTPTSPEADAAALAGLPAHHLAGRTDFPAGRIRLAALVADRLSWVDDPRLDD